MNIAIKPATRRVDQFVADEVADLSGVALAKPDPFLIDDPCPGSPDGHYPIWDHRTLVCPHCSKVLWSS